MFRRDERARLVSDYHRTGHLEGHHMTMERAITHRVSDSPDTRDFDYGIGDDLRATERQLRADIAARIRQTARQDALASWAEKQAYERAALVAENRL